MSHIRKWSVNVSVPTLDDFVARFPHYRNRAQAENKVFFDLIMSPASFVKASIANDDLALPAVAGVAKDCAAAIAGDLGPTDKQFIGAAVCVLMEKNGYSKTGKKRAIPHKAFSRGEVYQIG